MGCSYGKATTAKGGTLATSSARNRRKDRTARSPVPQVRVGTEAIKTIEQRHFAVQEPPPPSIAAMEGGPISFSGASYGCPG